MTGGDRDLVRAVEELRRELSDAHAREAATAEVLKVISRSRFDLQPVLDTLVRSAAQLCEADSAVMRRRANEAFPVAATYGLSQQQRDSFERYSTKPDRGSIFGRVVLEGRSVHVPDVSIDPEYNRARVQEGSVRAGLGVPLLRDGTVVGIFNLQRREPRAFSQKQIELVEAFADQAVIAIENARLFEEVQARTRELQAALEYQTATSDVLNVISRSAFDLQKVLETIAEGAARLCGGLMGGVFRYDGELMHLGALVNFAPGTEQVWRGLYPRAATPDTSTGRAILERRVVILPDVEADTKRAEWARERARIGGYRSAIAVPMLREGVPIGAIVVCRVQPGTFPESYVDLLKTFADQAVIAIENTRLFEEVQARSRELQKALEQQTATSAVLGVISSSPTNVQPVLDTIVKTATTLCASYDAVILLRDGETLRIAAHHGPMALDLKQLPLGRDSVAGRTVIDRVPVHVPDLLAEGEQYPRGREIALRLNQRTVLGLPLLREGQAIGCLFLRRTEVLAFTDNQIALLQTFADQAVIAIENTRLFEEEQARTKELTQSLEYQTAVNEVLGVISRSPTDVQPVFDTIAKSALHLCGGAFSSVLRFDGRLIHFAAAHGMTPEGFEALRNTYPLPPGRAGATTRAIETRALAEIPDVDADPNFEHHHIAGPQNFKSLASVPMLKDGRPIGTITVGQAKTGRFPEPQIALLRTFADQAVIAIENARLFEEVQARTTELAQSVDELRALGDVSQAVNSTINLEVVLSTIVAKAVQISGTTAGTIYVFDEASQEFRLRASYGMDDTLIAAVKDQPVHLGEKSVISQAAMQRTPVQLPDVQHESSSLVLDVILRAGFRALLTVPLLSAERIVGALVVRRKNPGEFPKNTVDLLQTFGAQSVLAIQNARLFEEIAQKGRELEIASQHKSQFVANMSHELRTPLAAILGYAELMQEGFYGAPSEKSMEALTRIRSNGKHLLGLINTVLDIAKIESGQFSLNLGEYAIDSVVETVCVATESLAATKKLALKAEVATRLPIGVGDEQRLTQVLLNLVGNAIKFTDIGEVRITASAANGHFTVGVTDTGPGIPPDELKRVFEQFHQVDNSNTKAKGGTGLGLAISKQIVEMHGGRIWVESTVGKGSTFQMELPVRAEAIKGAA